MQTVLTQTGAILVPVYLDTEEMESVVLVSILQVVAIKSYLCSTTMQILTSVKRMILTIVMRMQSVLTVMGVILVSVHLDILEMESIAMVSIINYNYQGFLFSAVVVCVCVCV